MKDAQDLDTVDQLIDGANYEEARLHLAGTEGDAAADVLRVKLEVRENSVEPGTALQRLLAIMRVSPTAARAQDLYREISELAYKTSGSTLAHSHPPPKPH